MTDPTTIPLACGDATASIALRGSEPVAWRAGGRDLLWHGHPDHWTYSAPILFPLVGASKDGEIRVAGRAYPMGQHGFARTAAFTLVERTASRVHLRLAASDETLARYPFRFRLDVTTTLGEDSLAHDVTVTNEDGRPMPYALGVHPAFVWPLGAGERADHRVVFAAPETPRVPEVAPGGLLARATRSVPLDGASLPLDPALFTEALVFLDAASDALTFEGPDGAAITLAGEGFRHLAVWTKPTAPFLSLEAWTGHADWEDATGDLETRDSMIVLAPGETRRHGVRYGYRVG